MRQPFGNDRWSETGTDYGAGARVDARLALPNDGRVVAPEAARREPEMSPFDVRPTSSVAHPRRRHANVNGSEASQHSTAAQAERPAQFDEAATLAARPPPAPPRFSMPHPLVAAVVGFICGMLTWHLIGFWTFVHDVAFNDERSGQLSRADDRLSDASSSSPYATKVRLSVASHEVAAAQITTGSIAPAARAGSRPAPKVAIVTDCILLVRNGTHGDTRPAACPELATPLRDAGRRGRSHRAPDVQARLGNQAAWASATDVSETAPPPSAGHAPDLQAPAAQASDASWSLTADDRLLDLDASGAPDRQIVEPTTR